MSASVLTIVLSIEQTRIHNKITSPCKKDKLQNCYWQEFVREKNGKLGTRKQMFGTV